MNDNDPILDACLEEVLGGQSPPDLTSRIMQAWSALPAALPTDTPSAPPLQNAAAAAIANHARDSVKLTRARAGQPAGSRPRHFGLAVSMVVAASVVAIGMGIVFALRSTPTPERLPSGLVQTTQPHQLDRIPDDAQPHPITDQPARVAPTRATPANEIAVSPVPEVVTPDFVTERPFPTTVESPAFDLATDTSTAIAARDEVEVVALINAAIRSGWQANDLAPAPRSSDDEFARRLFLQVLGRVPTAAESQAFVASRAKDKRGQLIDHLLTRDEHVTDLAGHWSEVWADGLVGHETTVVASGASRVGLEQYLRRSIQQATPLDQIANELLTATGAGEIGAPQYNGAANFLLTHFDGKATRTTAQVARALLGKRMQCAECHDHPTDSSLAQSRFWELNTFLRQINVQRSADAAVPPVLASRDFLGDGGGDGSDAEVFYETPRGEIKVAYPNLPGLTGIPRSGIVEEFDRRAGLARYVTTSREFRRAVVNRVWANIFGFGFTSPVDDLGPHNPPSHPELLDDLADQLAAHNHDLRTLIRWLVSSEPFQLGSQPVDDKLVDAPEAGRGRWFSRAYAPAEATPAVQESLVAMAKSVAEGKNELGIGTTANIKPAFPAPGRLNGADQPNSPLMIASPTVGQASNFVPAMIDRILDASMSSEQKLDHLFLVTLQRAPTRRERNLVPEITGGAVEETDRAGLLRVWWALERSRP